MKQTMTLDGNLWFTKDQERFLGGNRIALLEQIGEFGSITKAAKAIGVSYKTAWEMVNNINNLAASPLVYRTTGGKGGGGAGLTSAGREVIQKFRIIQEEHSAFLKKVGLRLDDTDQLYTFLRRISMRISARNVFSGSIQQIIRGAVNSEVRVLLKGGAMITAIITNGAVDNLGLKNGVEAYAIIKASSVILATDLAGARLSTRNQLNGSVSRLINGPVSCEVDVALPGGDTLSAVITQGSADRLALQEGSQLSALFKASSVILGVS